MIRNLKKFRNFLFINPKHLKDFQTLLKAHLEYSEEAKKFYNYLISYYYLKINIIEGIIKYNNSLSSSIIKYFKYFNGLVYKKAILLLYLFI